MNHIIDPDHRVSATKLRDLLSTYLNSEDLINIGAYKRGSSREIDDAIKFYPKIISFLKQNVEDKVSIEKSIESLTLLMEKGEF